MGHSKGGHFWGVCAKSVPAGGGDIFFYWCVCVPPFVSQQKKGWGDVFHRNIRLLKMLEMQVEHILNGIKIEANISSHRMLVNHFNGKG